MTTVDFNEVQLRGNNDQCFVSTIQEGLERLQTGKFWKISFSVEQKHYRYRWVSKRELLEWSNVSQKRINFVCPKFKTYSDDTQLLVQQDAFNENTWILPQYEDVWLALCIQAVLTVNEFKNLWKIHGDTCSTCGNNPEEDTSFHCKKCQNHLHKTNSFGWRFCNTCNDWSS